MVQLDDFRRNRIVDRQLGQRFVEVKQPFVRVGIGVVAQRHTLVVAAILLRGAMPSPFDKDPPHRLGRRCKEMAAIGELRRAAI
jgi:hypothetical protein